MNNLGPVIKLTALDYGGFRCIDRLHTNGTSHTKLKRDGDRWETVSHVEKRYRRPGDKWLP